MNRKEFRDCDIVMRYTSKKLQQPEVKMVGDEECTMSPAMEIIPCAISSEVPTDIALSKLREYKKKEMPGLVDADFSLEGGWCDHMMTNFPKDEKIIFISSSGCTLGPQ